MTRIKNLWPEAPVAKERHVSSLTEKRATPVVLAAVIVGVLLLAAGATHMGADEGAWSYVGRVWQQDGVAPYTGAYDDKAPGIYIVFAISSCLFGVGVWFPRLLGCLAMGAAAGVVYLIASDLHSRRSGVFAMVLFGLSMSWWLLDGPYAAQTESFMVLFVALALLALIRSLSARSRRRRLAGVFLSGVFIGLAISFKQIAVFSALGLLLFYLVFRRQGRPPRRRVLPDVACALAGTAVAVAAVMVPVLLSGVTIAEYWRGAWAVFLQPGSTSSNADPLSRALYFVQCWMDSRILLFLPLLAVFVLLRKSCGPVGAILLWASADFVGVNAGGSYYGHQLKQLIPSLAVAGGIALSALIDATTAESLRPKRTARVLAAIVLLWMPYQTLLRLAFMRPGADEAGTLGAWVRDNTEKGDRVFVVGDSASPSTQVLAYSMRTAPGRYFSWFYFRTPAVRRELPGDLEARPPELLLLHSATVRYAPEYLRRILRRQIGESYRLDCRRGGYRIYRLDPSSAPPVRKIMR